MTLTVRDFLDRFTQTDDLLRKLIQEQNTTNQLLYSFLRTGSAPQSIIISSPEGESQSAPILSDNYKTFIYRANNIVINSSSFVNQQAKIFEKIGISGIIKQIKLLSDVSDSDNSSYGIRIMSDDDVLLEATYSELATYSNYESDITVYNDSSYYIMIIEEISFTNSIRIEVYNSDATFDLVEIKYHQRV